MGGWAVTAEARQAIDSTIKALYSGKDLTFFLGAGASCSAGAPSGAKVVHDLVLELFRELNSRDPANDDELNTWLACQTWYKPENQYSDVLREALPDRWQRREYFEGRLSNLKPSPGHRSLARVMGSALGQKHLQVVLTTNFDWLVETALIEETNVFPAVYDQAHQLPGDIGSLPMPRVVKLHGDYFYDDIKNLEEELTQAMTGAMRNALQDCLRGRGLIVLGYRGADRTIMEEITKLAASPRDFLCGGLVWVHREEERFLTEEVKELCARAKHNGVDARPVHLPNDSFTEFIGQLEERLCPTPVLLTVDPLPCHLAELRQKLSPKSYGYFPQKMAISVGSAAAETVDPISIVRALHPGELAFLIGDSGCGKTSTLAWLGLALLNEHRSVVWTEITRGSIALDLSSSEETLLDAGKGNVPLFIDGLDQSAKPEDVLNGIDRARSVWNCPVVVASRPIEALSTRKEVLFEFRPLTPDEMRQFVVSAWSEKLADAFFKELATGKQGMAELSEMCTNPMLLKMAATVFARGDQLRSKSRLYDDLTRYRLKFYRRQYSGPEADLRMGAEKAAYVVETRPSKTWRDLAQTVAAGDERDSATNPDHEIAKHLMRCGLIRSAGKEWEFFHRSYQPYFAARRVVYALESAKPDRSYLSKVALTSEICEFIGSYYDELPERMERLKASLQRDPASFDYGDVNLRYAAAFCSSHRGDVVALVTDDLTRNRWESQGEGYFQEGALLNSAMTGVLFGDPWCVRVFYEIWRRDRCDDSWNLCRFGGPFHRVADKPLHWDLDFALGHLAKANPSSDEPDLDTLGQVLMHVGHLACDGKLNEVTRLRDMVHDHVKKQWPVRLFRVPMNATYTLYRIRSEESLDVLFDAYGDGKGFQINWRIPRTVVRAIFQVAPRDHQRKRRAVDFIQDVLRRVGRTSPYQRDFLRIQCFFALNAIGEELHEGEFGSTPAMEAVRTWARLKGQLGPTPAS